MALYPSTTFIKLVINTNYFLDWNQNLSTKTLGYKGNELTVDMSRSVEMNKC